MEHDLTTATGVFGYFAEHTKILDPVKAEFEKLGAENAQLKKENEQLKADNVSTMVALTEVYEKVITLGGSTNG